MYYKIDWRMKRLREKFGENSKNFIQNKYSIEKMVESFEKIFLL